MGWLCLFVGGVGALVALLWRVLPSRCESIAFGLTIMPPVAMCLVHVGAFVFSDVRSGWETGAAWAAWALIIWVVSGWPNPTPREEIQAIIRDIDRGGAHE